MTKLITPAVPEPVGAPAVMTALPPFWFVPTPAEAVSEALPPAPAVGVPAWTTTLPPAPDVVPPGPPCSVSVLPADVVVAAAPGITCSAVVAVDVYEAVAVEAMKFEPAVIVVVEAIVPGAMNVVGVDSVTAPVDADAVIWLAVPAIDVTPAFATVIEPEPLVIVMPAPCVSVASVYVEPLPINS